MRVLGYARVSSEEQARGSSLGDQQNAIRAYALGRKLKVTRFYVEAESAVHEKIERREQIQALLRDVRKGDLVLCDKLDRWSRDPEFTYRSVRELLAAGASFYAVGDACDPSTPEGDTALGFRILFAREEHKRIRQRMVGTRELLRDRGYWVEGVVPFGYRRPPPSKTDRLAKNILVVHAEEAAVVRRVFALYLRGRSMQQTANDIGRPMYFVQRILARRFYIGEQENSRGEWMRGMHEPIIDAATFMRAQEAAQTRRLGGARPRDASSETDEWILRDVARCAKCGARMSAAYAGEKRARRYYYRCSHACMSTGTRATHGGHIPLEEAEGPAEVLVRRRLGEIRKALQRTPDAEAPPAKDYAAQRAKLQRKRERLQEMYADEAMSREELRAATAKLDAERLRINGEEGAAKAPRPLSTRAERREALRHVATIKGLWDEADGRVRRQIVNRLAVQVALRKGLMPAPEWRAVERIDLDSLVNLLVSDS